MADESTTPEKHYLSTAGGKTNSVSKVATDEEMPSFHLKIWAPFKVYFDNMAYSITALNETGPFDVLAHHKNFMTLLSPCDLVINAPRGTQKIKITRGIMHVHSDVVNVFLDV